MEESTTPNTSPFYTEYEGERIQKEKRPSQYFEKKPHE
jgi:hypothetical protein